MRASLRRRRAPARSPTRSTAYWRRRGRAPAFPRMLRPSARSYGTLRALRRAIPLLAGCAALLCAVPAAAQLRPVHHTGSRVRIGTFPTFTGSAQRVRVIVGPAAQPLALRRGRGLLAGGARRKLDVRSAFARAYLHLLERQQARTVV